MSTKTGFAGFNRRKVKPEKPAMQKTINEIRDELERLKSDARMAYGVANVFINAPLALIQMEVGAKIHALEWALGLPSSKFPLPAKKA